jgi:signal transduction histidine kinase
MNSGLNPAETGNSLQPTIECPVNINFFSLDTHFRYTTFSEFHAETMKRTWGTDIQVGMAILDLVSDPVYRQKSKENFERALREEYFIVKEDFHVNETARSYFENYFCAIKDQSGGVCGISVFVIDITATLQTQTYLDAALEKVESGIQLKKAFMQNISHEMRTPLNGIIGFGNLLATQNLKPKEKKHYAEMLNISCNRLLNTITDYIDISLIESGSVDFSLNQIAIKNFLESMVPEFRSLCEKKGLSFHVRIPSSTDQLLVSMDSEVLKKIITLLFDNAIKFTPQGSITLGFKILGDNVELFITDTGIGIEKTKRDIIFEPFMQEISTVTQGYEGNGLGLAIARGFLKLLGGEIRVESVKGEGSSFFVTLPGSPRTKNRQVESTERVWNVERPPVVLIAEDDFYSDYFLEFLLSSLSVVVLKAADGKAAVEMCRNRPDISLVLMDLKMPGMDGINAMREIRSFRKDLPLIAIIAYTLGQDKKEVLKAGCNDFLTKPVNLLMLKEKLQAYGVIG